MLQFIDEAIQMDLASLKQEDSLFEKERILSEPLQTVADKVEEGINTQEEQLEKIKEPVTEKETKKEVSFIQKTHKALLNDYLPRRQKYKHHTRLLGHPDSLMSKKVFIGNHQLRKN